MESSVIKPEDNAFKEAPFYDIYFSYFKFIVCKQIKNIKWNMLIFIT